MHIIYSLIPSLFLLSHTYTSLTTRPAQPHTTGGLTTQHTTDSVTSMISNDYQ